MRACKAAEVCDYICALPAAIFMVAPVAEPGLLER
jgi:hypothetical protein